MKELLATLLILCAGPVWAGWVHYAESIKDNQYFYDPSSIKGKTVKKVWTRDEFPSAGQGFRSRRTLWEIDCKDEKVRALSRHKYSKPNLEGEITEMLNEPSSWSYVPPDTILKELFDITCGKK